MVDAEDYFMLKDLAREQEQTTGRVTINELSRETGFDRKIVRYYLARASPPETPRQRSKPSKLESLQAVHPGEAGKVSAPEPYPSP